MKSITLTAMASLIALPTLASDEASDPSRKLIDDGRYMSVLNAQNLTDIAYQIPKPQDESVQFAFTLKGYVFGFRMIKADFRGHISEADYAAYTDLKTSGLGALLKKLDIWSVSKGQISENGEMHPDFHVQQNTNEKNRRVEMNYDRDAQSVSVNIVPPLGSQGEPPASAEERFNAFDTVTALLHMTRKGRPDPSALCKGSVPVFDSKQHYNLRLAPVGQARVKFLGDKQAAIHCHVFYEPVSGFDPEDLPDLEEASTPIDVYFKYYPEVDMHVPVRFTYRISSIKATIKMTKLTFVTPEGQLIHEEK